MSNLLKTAADRIILDENGVVLRAGARPTARISLTISPGADSFQVDPVSIPVGVTSIWVGASRRKTILVADLPAQVLWSEVTVGSGLNVHLKGGVTGDVASWDQRTGRGTIEPGVVEPFGEIADVLLFLGDPAYSLDISPFFASDGSPLTFSMTVDGLTSVAGWTLTSSALAITTGAARPNSVVELTAIHSVGGAVAKQTFRVEIRTGAVLAAPVWTGAVTLADRIAVVGDGSGTITYDAGALMTGTIADWSMTVGGSSTLPTGFSITSAGVISMPTGTARALGAITFTATNASGSVTKTFNLEVQASAVGTLSNDEAPALALRANETLSIGADAETSGATWLGPTPHYGRWLFYKDGVKMQADAVETDPATWTGVSNRILDLQPGTYTARVGRIFDGPPVQKVWIAATGSIVIPAAPIPVGVIPAPTAAMVQRGQLNGTNKRAAQIYDFAEYGFKGLEEFQSTGVSNKKGVFLSTIVAIAAYLGDTTLRSGQTPAQYMVATISKWCADGLPAARGGLTTQVDLCFVFAVLFGKYTPAVWDNLTAAEKTKCDLVMKGLLVTCCYQNSDQNPFVKSGDDERSITGSQYGRGRVPNFTTPSVLMPGLCIAYFGNGNKATGVTFCNDFLSGFDRDNFTAAILATQPGANPTAVTGGLRDLWNTFRQNWVQGGPYNGNPMNGPGPTKAQLEASLKGKNALGAVIPYEQFGRSIDKTEAEINGQITKTFGSAILPGANVTATSGLSGGSDRVAGKHGVFERLTFGAKNNGRGAQVGCITETVLTGAGRESGTATEPISGKDAWESGEHDYAGPKGAHDGMATELNARDGGDGQNGGPRSSMAYAAEGVVIILPSILAFAAFGLLDTTNAQLKTGLDRCHRGMVDRKFREKYGHRGYAKGGRFGADDGTSVDWFTVNSIGFNYDVLDEIWFSMLQGWSGLAKNTVLPVITNQAKVGIALACSDGTWLNGPTLTRKWQRRTANIWADIAGATGANYTPVAADVGKPLRVEMKAAVAGREVVYARTAATANVLAA